jgi:hypothetical protein
MFGVGPFRMSGKGEIVARLIARMAIFSARGGVPLADRVW